MDNATAAAVAAVAVAVVALSVALAQVLQQYFATGSLLRLCDTTVYGTLPGRGRRIWKSDQFRFRVIYSLPQIRLRRHFWPDEQHDKSIKSSQTSLEWVSLCNLDSEEDPSHFQVQNPVVIFSEKKSHRRNIPYDDFEPTGKHSGEASWASFARVVQYSCDQSLRFDIIEGDADRCPSDLSVVPMQVSLRDIVVMGIMAGMRISSADLYTGSLSMAGSAGSITSSKHPILGSIIHFNPTNVDAHFGWRIQHGEIDRLWVGRMKDELPIAGRSYTWKDREHIVTYDEKWVRSDTLNEDFPFYKRRAYDVGMPKCPPQKTSARPEKRTTTYAFTGANLFSPTEHIIGPVLSQSTDVIPLSEDVVEIYPHGFHDEAWCLMRASGKSLARSMGGPVNDQTHVLCEDSEEQNADSALPRSSYSTRIKRWLKDLLSRQRFESTEDSTPVALAEARQVSRDTIEKIVHGSGSTANLPQLSLPSPTRGDCQGQRNSSDTDRPTREQETSSASRLSLLQPSVNQDQIEVPGEVEDQDGTAGCVPAKAYQPNVSEEVEGEEIGEIADRRLVLAATSKFKVIDPNRPQYHTKRESSESIPNRHVAEGEEPDDSDHKPEEARKARESQEQRDFERAQRDRARKKRKQQRRRQYEARPGEFDWRWLSQMNAIPGYCATPWSRIFPMRTYIGIISVVLEALAGLVNKQCIQYVHDRRLWETALTWAKMGRSTWPSYAINARGGVVVNGDYIGAKFPGFAGLLARIELFENPGFQTNQNPLMGDFWDKIRLAELMMLDSWLAICGRAPEIVDGKCALLRNMPALIQFVLDDFRMDFEAIDRSANEGGLQLIQDVATNLIDFLNGERLSKAEQIFTLGAMLRTAKAGVCVAIGPDTSRIDDILWYDTRVWLA